MEPLEALLSWHDPEDEEKKIRDQLRIIRSLLDDIESFVDDGGTVFDRAANGARSLAELYIMCQTLSVLRVAKSLQK